MYFLLPFPSPGKWVGLCQQGHPFRKQEGAEKGAERAGNTDQGWEKQLQAEARKPTSAEQCQSGEASEPSQDTNVLCSTNTKDPISQEM